MSDVIVAPHVRDLETLAGQLADWLGSKLPDAHDIRLDDFKYPRGAGQSHETILFDAAWTEQGRERRQGYVVRIKPTSHTVYPDDMFEEQYLIMKALGQRGPVRVAKVYWMEKDPDILGAPFFLMEKKLGRVAVSVPRYAETGWVAEATPAQRRTMWENGVRQLAAIQAVPVAELDFLKSSTSGAEQGLEQEFAKFVRFAEWVQQERKRPILDEAIAWLRAHWPANRPDGTVWGDARLGNMMFDEHFDVVAVMDWEQPGLGGALNDLAWWVYNSEIMHGAQPGRPALAGMGTRDETIALWHEVTGISVANFDWYENFTALKYGCLGCRSGALGMHQAMPDSFLEARLAFARE